MYEIIFYRDRKGKNEVEDYINELGKKSEIKEYKVKLSKIVSYMRLLKENGLSIGEPYIKYLKDDIWELRPMRDRILFAYYDNNKFIMLNIFLKQTQKTPSREIEKAKRKLKDFKERKDEYGKETIYYLG